MDEEILSNENIFNYINPVCNITSKHLQSIKYSSVSSYDNMIHVIKNSYINGNIYENDESTSYGNVNIIISDLNGKQLGSETSINGSINLTDLENNKTLKLSFEDKSNKYMSKYIYITPQIDYQKDINIIEIYKSSISAVYKIRYNGTPSLSLNGNNSAVLTKINDEYYKVTNIETENNYTLMLIDFVENNPYILEKNF